MTKKVNHYFKHEYDAAHSRKLVMLRRRGGYEAIGHYWTVYPIIHKASNCYPFATDSDREVLADSLQVATEVLDKFIKLCEECENLLEIRDGFLWSEKVESQLAEQQGVSESRAESGRKGGLAKASKRLAKGKQNVASREEKSRSREEKKPVFILPQRLNNPQCQDALNRWVKYRTGIKKKLSADSVNQILKDYAEKPSDLIKDINNSIKQGWQGLFAPSTNGAKQEQQKATVPYNESPHPALRAEREREAKAALENLGLGGLAK